MPLPVLLLLLLLQGQLPAGQYPALGVLTVHVGVHTQDSTVPPVEDPDPWPVIRDPKL